MGRRARARERAADDDDAAAAAAAVKRKPAAKRKQPATWASALAFECGLRDLVMRSWSCVHTAVVWFLQKKRCMQVRACMSACMSA